MATFGGNTMTRIHTTLAAASAVLALSAAPPAQAQDAARETREVLDSMPALIAQMTDKHPQARVAQQIVARVEHELAHEIRQAMQTTETELSVNRSLVGRLHQQRDEVRTKLDRLAEHRAEYEQLTSQVTHFTTELHRAQTAQVMRLMKKLSLGVGCQFNCFATP